MLKRNQEKHLLAAILVMTLALLPVSAISSISDAATKKAKGVTLKIGKKTVTKKTYSLVKGKKATIKVSVSPKNTKKSVTYKSKNKKIATVSKKGVVKAKKKGSTKISVIVKMKNKKSISTWLKVKVKEKKPSAAPAPTPEPAPIKISDINVADGTSNVYGKLYTPEKEGVYPAIIMCHGYNGTNADFVSECRYFAQNGYVACAIDFCGGSTRSKSSGKTTDMTIFTEKSNLLAVFNHIKTLPNVNKERIFLHGGSQGGLVAALAAEEVVDEVKGLILYFPAFNIPDNWRNNYPDVNKIPAKVDFWGLTLGKVFFTSMHDFYPFDNIGKFTKNVLILHGKKDVIVSSSVVERAKATYKNCSLITYANEGHGFTPSVVVKARQETFNFMQKQLQRKHTL